MVVKCIVGLFWGTNLPPCWKLVPWNSPTMHLTTISTRSPANFSRLLIWQYQNRPGLPRNLKMGNRNARKLENRAIKPKSSYAHNSRHAFDRPFTTWQFYYWRKRFLLRMVLETPKGIEFDATNKKVYEQREIIGLAERQCSTSSKKYPVN